MTLSEHELGLDMQFNGDYFQVTPGRRPQIIADRDNVGQALKNRLRTVKGELNWNQYYGSNLYRLIGKPINDTTLSQAKLYAMEEVLADPRVKNVLDVQAEALRTQANVITLSMTVILIDNSNPYNLVYDFYLQGIST